MLLRIHKNSKLNIKYTKKYNKKTIITISHIR